MSTHPAPSHAPTEERADGAFDNEVDATAVTRARLVLLARRREQHLQARSLTTACQRTLHTAIGRDWVDVVRRQHELGADLDAPMDGPRYTDGRAPCGKVLQPLSCGNFFLPPVALMGNTNRPMVKLLLDLGADIDATHGGSPTALAYAVMDWQTINRCLHGGHFADLEDKREMKTQQCGYLKLIMLLLRRGARRSEMAGKLSQLTRAIARERWIHLARLAPVVDAFASWARVRFGEVHFKWDDTGAAAGAAAAEADFNELLQRGGAPLPSTQAEPRLEVA